MSETRLAQKVGLFAVAAIVLLVLLLLSFSKGLRWFTPTYELRLKATTVAGLKARSLVLMNGVAIGSVASAEVSPNGKGVTIRLKIREGYTIHADARFVIEQIGFLGDQYVAIYPQDNTGPILTPDDEVVCEEPFHFQEAVRSTTVLIQRLDQTVKILHQAIERLDRTVLSEQALTNLQVSFAQFRGLSERTLNLVDGINHLVQTNVAPVNVAVSNLVHFTETADKFAVEARQTLSDSRDELSSTLKNLESASRTLERLAKDLDGGKGLAGALLKDEDLKANVVNAAAYLDNVASNLNKYGLLYKPKPTKTNVPPALLPGKHPFN